MIEETPVSIYLSKGLCTEWGSGVGALVFLQPVSWVIRQTRVANPNYKYTGAGVPDLKL